MKILVNTISTKKHSGGAYQIAYNFLMKTMEHQEVEWIYVVSSDLDEILPVPMKEGKNYHVFPTQPDYLHTYKKVKAELKELEKKEEPDVVYSITAPSYFTFDTVEVMRFTNPWVTHPNKWSWSILPWKKRMRMYLYCWNQRRLLRKCNYFITQTETTKKGIMQITGKPSENVCVVSNVLPAVFAQQDSTHYDYDSKWIDVACVGAPVPHKNFDIIPATLKELENLGVANVRFHVTIPSDDPTWAKIRRLMKEYKCEDRVINHGRMSQSEMAMMYRQCRFAFLPTLLEVFSASTLEAMYFDLKIVATDFSFNKEVIGDAGLYYKPMDPMDAAKKFRTLINDACLQETLSKRMKEKLSNYENYDKHFNDIVSYLMRVAKC